ENANSRGAEGSTPELAHSLKRSTSMPQPMEANFRLAVMKETARQPRSVCQEKLRQARWACPLLWLRAPCCHSRQRHCRMRCADRLPPDSRGSDRRAGSFVEQWLVSQPPVGC